MIYQEKKLTQKILESLDKSIVYKAFTKNNDIIFIKGIASVSELAVFNLDRILLPLNPPSKEEIEKKAIKLYPVGSDSWYELKVNRQNFINFYTQALIDIGFKKEEIK